MRGTKRGLALAAGLLLAAGCGTHSTNATWDGSANPDASRTPFGVDPVTLLSQAPGATTAAGSAKLTTTITVATTAAHLVLSGAGLENFAGHTYAFTATLTGVQTGILEVRSTNGLRYVKPPPGSAAALSHGKAWIAFDPAKAGSVPGLAEFAQVAQDPTAPLLLLPSVSQTVSRVGQEDVHGQPSTHYAATLDLAVTSRLTPDQQTVAGELARQLGTTTLPVDVWVDAQGRITRYSQTVSPAATGETVATTVDLYDYETPAVVTAPPAGETHRVT
jgi:hypothetical protein